jgi:hypothetical protein
MYLRRSVKTGTPKPTRTISLSSSSRVVTRFQIARAVHRLLIEYAKVSPTMPAGVVAEYPAGAVFDLSLVINAPTPAPAVKELVSGASATCCSFREWIVQRPR